MPKNKIETTKTVVKFVVARCVGTTISTVITQNVSVEKPAEKAQIIIGSHVVGSMVAHRSEAYVDKTIDDLVKAWNDLKNSKKDN